MDIFAVLEWVDDRAPCRVCGDVEVATKATAAIANRTLQAGVRPFIIPAFYVPATSLVGLGRARLEPCRLDWQKLWLKIP
jgi:hypothetical protein